MKENRWRKSSSSQPNGGNCVELAAALDALRDSKTPAGPVLKIRTLPTLLNQIKEGRFD